MSSICNSLTSCFGCCPWSGIEYTTQIRAPDGTYVPVDKYRQIKTRHDNWSSEDSGSPYLDKGDPRCDPRDDIYPADSEEYCFKAVAGFNYERYGFVQSSIGWILPDSKLAEKYTWKRCNQCSIFSALIYGCAHKKKN